MRVAIDANVWLDFFTEREPGFQASSRCIELALTGEFVALVPAHLVTTLYYVVRRHLGRASAAELIEWLITEFEVGPCDKNTFMSAKALDFNDFEDAVVHASAQKAKCKYIISWNTNDFTNGKLPVLKPDSFLAMFESGK